MKVKTNGIEINYEVEGNGPWITLSHSLACNLHMWDEQMELLTRHFKVLRQSILNGRMNGLLSGPSAPKIHPKGLAVVLQGQHDG
jgi:3-oxoadipate enol-lactonase